MNEELNEQQEDTQKVVEETNTQQEDTQKVVENKSEESNSESNTDTEKKEDVKKSSYKLDTSGLSNAKQRLDSLNEYKEQPQQKVNSDNYEYDEENDVWVDKQTGDTYDEKPEQQKQVETKQFDSYKWNLQQTQQEYERQKESVAYSAEQSIVNMFYEKSGDMLKGLSDAQIEVLKTDCCLPIIQELRYNLANDNLPNDDTFSNMQQKLEDSIESHMSIYNIRGQVQNIVNETHNEKYPLESQQPTNVYGVEDNRKKTWYGTSPKERDNFITRIYNKMTNAKL